MSYSAVLLSTATFRPDQVGSGATDGSKYLRDDGTWAPVAGGSGAPTDAQYITLASNGTLSAERVLTAGSGISFTDAGAGGALTITNTGSGGAPTGAQYVTLATDAGLSAERVLTAGSGISFTDAGANGNLTITNTGALTAAPTDAQYLTLATNGTLSAERVLTAGSGISFTDAGAGGALTITNTQAGGGAPTTAQYLTLATDAGLSAERVLTAGSGISFTDAGADGALTVTNTLFGWNSMSSTTVNSMISATALSTVTGLALAVSANSSYRFQYYALVSTATLSTNGIRLAATCPASPTVFAYRIGLPIAVPGTGAELQGFGAASGSSAIGTAFPAANAQYLAIVEGLLINGANAGNINLQFGSELAASTNSIHANSYGFLQVLR